VSVILITGGWESEVPTYISGVGLRFGLKRFHCNCLGFHPLLSLVVMVKLKTAVSDNKTNNHNPNHNINTFEFL
jgi:hypothetical protein